jgi:hypothetical protein
MAFRQFTLRIDPDIYRQIEARSVVTGRSINKELELLIAFAIDRKAECDEATIQKIRDHLDGKNQQPSPTAQALGLA